LDHHGLLNDDGLGNRCNGLDGLLNDDLLDGLLNKHGLLNDHWRGSNVNGLRLERFGQEQTSSDAGDHACGDCGPVATVGLRARDGRAEQSEGCDCDQGLLHTFSFVLLAWTESMIDYSEAGGNCGR